MDRASIAASAELAGLVLDPQTDVAIIGGDPLVRSPFHLAEGAAVALALVGQEVDRLWRLRNGGPRQAIRIDARHALHSLASYTLLSVDGRRAAPQPFWSPLTRLYACRDGRYVHLHDSFTDAELTLAELGLAPGASREAIAAAVAGRDADELEAALAARGLCVAICFSADEWAAHPQGRLLAGKPVVEVLRIGEAPPEPLSAGARPLSGVRVLDLTRALAGPAAARTLAEQGADVLHVTAPHLPTFAVFEMDTGHGKRQASLDLDAPGDAAILADLAAEADIFIQGYRDGALARRGFGPEALAKRRPGIIYVSLNTFGHDGPWHARPGWEQMAQTVSGVALHQGGGTRPHLAPAALSDYTTASFAAVGAMLALRRRATVGGSWLVRVSLTRTAMWYLRLGGDLDPMAGGGAGHPAPAMDERETPWGWMRFLRSPLELAATPSSWELPSAPPGSHEPCWLPR
jgi:crotonobetainyl-CoA:carnitine CoA-transferase CaiB-like acyl-CoA transferase